MRICLAPMDGITDLAYRTICKEVFEFHGNPDDTLMLWTEFMSAEGYKHNPPGVIRHMFKTDFEPQLIAQIFGGTTDPLLHCALDLHTNYGFTGIEINMGCPSPSVMKCDAGSAMLKNKPRTLQILEEIRSQLPCSLSLKTRIGMNEADKEAQFDFIIQASRFVDMITIHGRTYAQSHGGNVDRDYIYRVKDALPEKIIIGNGGIRSYQDGQEKCGILDGVMPGQSAIGNPWILTPHTPSIEERFAVIFRHLAMMMASEYVFHEAVATMKEHIVMPSYEQLCHYTAQADILTKQDDHVRAPLEFRKYLFNYISGLDGNKAIKQQIPGRKDYQSLKEGLLRYQETLIRAY